MQYFQKSMRDEIYFLPAGKRKSFIQVDSITLDVLSQTCLKYPKTTSLHYLGNISRKMWRMKLIFFLLINVKDLFRVILSFLMCVVRHAQTIQNNKFALSPQRLKKEVSKKLMFCMQISMKACYKLIQWFWWGWSKIPKVASLQCLYKISKKNSEMKLSFCMHINIKVFYKVILSLLMDMIKHFESTQSNKLAISLQYLKIKK